jgi:hypothetical protein
MWISKGVSDPTICAKSNHPLNPFNASKITFDDGALWQDLQITPKTPGSL